ncbi:acyl-CoA synthetase (NDP forming)/RimJ/RimL family protein N-acetyltransferase [Amycolatopsis magusensis]|uniref:Acyl-CoA synthetase (NDP forming)/RimJ/RimL family protein N-acetyltransferase n=1 Tax=Amycolatopsis magusensis TaxID=882444 RepID=A0ABS4PYN9_9PSEU|nr:acyl-CoA synthetase (NDP forming)/RimJ/RimL family protein N-acetyltransferase [Amycolatopsis magusensis]
MTVDVGARAVLADGQVARLRLLHPEDAAAVLALHEELSARDRYFRFFGPAPKRLDDLAAKIAADAGPQHAAIGAFLEEKLIGVANYYVLRNSGVAEVAVAVDGTVHAHGVATLLLEHLAAVGRSRGLTRFVAEVLAENARMIQVLTDLGMPYEFRGIGAEREVSLSLRPTEQYLDAVVRRDLVADSASLRHFFRPASVAVVGAGRGAGSVGRAVLANILRSGFPGSVSAVNPHATEILGVPCHPSVAELPETPELVVIAAPAAACESIVEQCGERGVAAVVLLSAGLTGERAGERVVAAVRRHGMRLVGPNCLGVLSTEPGHPLDATFLRDPVAAGPVGVVTQSGGVGIALAGALTRLGIGVSGLVSTGDKYDVSGNDLLLRWRSDERTEIAVLYLESFGNPRKFSRLAAALAREKPVLAVRNGSGLVAQDAAASHTAAAATPAVTRDALYEQAGVIAVDSVTELTDVIAALAWQPLPAGGSVAIVSNAGGAGVLAADACERAGLSIAELTAGTARRLASVLPAQARIRNPVDTTAAVPAAAFGESVRLVLEDENVDALLVVTVPTAVGDPLDGVAPVLTGTATKTVLAVRPGQPARVRPLGEAVTASYDDPVAAAIVLRRLVSYRNWLDQPREEVRLSPAIDAPAVTSLVQAALARGAGWLPPGDCAELLRLAGIPLVTTRYVTTEQAVVAELTAVGGPVAIKADAAGLLHKSVGGGVFTGVLDADGAREAVRTFQRRFGDDLRGFVVQPMAPPGRELLVGVRSDEVFGPLVVFGVGGVDTDLIDDRCARLAPLDGAGTELLMDGLRSSKALWAGARGPRFGARGAVARERPGRTRPGDRRTGPKPGPGVPWRLPRPRRPRAPRAA